jgi:uncharacterized protein YjdB
VATPTADPVTGAKVLLGTKIKLKCATEGAKIYYTVNDNGADPGDPGTLGQEYTDTSVIEITKDDTRVFAIAKKDQKYDSAQLKAVYTLQAKWVEAVNAYPPPQAFNPGMKITLKTNTENATIYYTTDGTEPVQDDEHKYSDEEKISIEEDTAIKAYAVKEGFRNSVTKEFKYTMNENVFIEVNAIIFNTTTVVVNKTLPLKASVQPDTASVREIEWSIVENQNNCISLSPDKSELKGIKEGKAVIQAKVPGGSRDGYDDFPATFNITVNPEFVEVKGIDLYKTNVLTGGNLVLDYTIEPDAATSKKVVWSIVEGQTETDAAILNNDTLTANRKGIVKVKASIENGSKGGDVFEKTFKIEVKDFVAVKAIDLKTKNVAVGEYLTLNGVITPEEATNQRITWTIESDDDNTGAQIRSGNRLKADTVGTVLLRATIENGKLGSEDREYDDFTSESISIEVTEKAFVPVGDIIFLSDETVLVGKTLALTGKVEPPGADQNIEWSIVDGEDEGDPAASIAENILTAQRAGTVTVKATVQKGAAGQNEEEYTSYEKPFQIDIKEQFNAVTSITLRRDRVASGEEVLVTIQPGNATNKKIDWTIEDAGDIDVSIDNNTNVLTANKAGSVKVNATIKNGIEQGRDFIAPLTITIKSGFIAVQSIELSSPDNFKAKESLTLAGTITPDDATKQNITWTIAEAGDTGASITNGVLTAKKAGSVKVQASIKGGLGKDQDFVNSEPFSIEVKEAFIAVTGIRLSENGKKVKVGENLTLEGKISPSDATKREIEWRIESDGGTGANITNGVLTATTAGTVKVKAVVTDGRGEGENFNSETFDIKVEDAFTEVSRIILISDNDFEAGGSLSLNTTIEPEGATNKEITWSIASAGGTGASITNGVLTANTKGTVDVKATVLNGKKKGNFDQTFTITVNKKEDAFVSAEGISLVSSKTVIAGISSPLIGTVNPPGATKQTIEWSIESAGDTGASITNGALMANKAGPVNVKAVVRDGKKDDKGNFQNVETAFSVYITDQSNKPDGPPDSGGGDSGKGGGGSNGGSDGDGDKGFSRKAVLGGAAGFSTGAGAVGASSFFKKKEDGGNDEDEE